MTDFAPFTPHPLLRSGHQQTIFTSYFRGRLPPYRAAPHFVDLPDGDQIVLHDDCPREWRAGERVALLLHGVAGCHGSPYLVRVAAKLNEVGVRTFRMDLRGCGAGMKLAQQIGHAGRSEDARAAAAFLADLCPHSPCTIIGFSMGANITLKLLGECHADWPENLDSGVAIAPPIDLVCCGQNIDRGFNRVYSRKFASLLYNFVQQRREFMPRLRELNLRPIPRSIVDFDNRVTAPLSGYHDVWDYYRQASSAPSLRNVRVPTLIITARDDAVIPIRMFERADFSAATQLVVTQYGGHVAFYGRRSSDPDRWWIDWRIIEWMRRRLSPTPHEALDHWRISRRQQRPSESWSR